MAIAVFIAKAVPTLNILFIQYVRIFLRFQFSYMTISFARYGKWRDPAECAQRIKMVMG
jgi:hypothetical protein